MSVLDHHIIEQAYAFFHQKERVYAHSTSEREKDHIEDAIASYVNAMSPALYAVLSEGNDAYLKEHDSFGEQLRDAIEKMERMLSENPFIEL